MDELPETKKGRTKVADVDRATIYKLASIGCTLEEIGYITNLNHETIRKHFGDIYTIGQANIKKALRRKQFERAMEGSDRMLIWLGKQMLGQKEVPIDTDIDQPLPWKDD